MQTTIDFLFFINLSLLVVHEFDAIRRKEWCLFIFLNKMEDERAYQLFALLHIPFLMLIFWFLTQQAESSKFWFQVIVDSFLVIHWGLHALLRDHAHNQFDGNFSRRVIQSMAVLGLIHLLIVVL